MCHFHSKQKVVRKEVVELLFLSRGNFCYFNWTKFKSSVYSKFSYITKLSNCQLIRAFFDNPKSLMDFVYSFELLNNSLDILF